MPIGQHATILFYFESELSYLCEGKSGLRIEQDPRHNSTVWIRQELWKGEEGGQDRTPDKGPTGRGEES
jgi:hypothetical protein